MKKIFNKLYNTYSYRMSLVNKLFISYIVVIIIPLLLFTYFSQAHVSQTLIKQFKYSSNVSLLQTDAYLNRILNEITKSTEQVVFNRTVTEIYENNMPDNILFDRYEDFQTVYELFDDIFQSDALYSVEVYTNGKYVLKESRGGTGVTFISAGSAFGKELDSALSEFRGELLWLPSRDVNYNFSKKNISVITGARYFKSKKTNKNIGILTVNIDRNFLNSIINHSPVMSNSATVILDNNGNLIANSDDDFLEKYGIKTALLSDSIAENKDSFAASGEKLMLNYIKTDVSEWTLVSLVPYSEILQTSNSTRITMFITMLCISSLFYLVAYFLSRLLTKRIRFLATCMKEERFDNYRSISFIEGTDEICDLNNSYIQLIDKINDYANSHYRMGIKLKDSELKALQAQINPHFLYNTLDMLNWIAHDYGATEISEIVSLLSKYYKLSLSNGAELVTVRDSVKHLEIYIKLSNYRFDNSIQLNLNISPEIYDCAILKLLLQPIVENSVLHGIRGKQEQSGAITINGCLVDNTLEFSITDDGIGMSEEQIAQLTSLSEIPNEADSDSDSIYAGGFGIKNVIERIKLYYGEDYGLEFNSVPGKGTTVTLRIPYSQL